MVSVQTTPVFSTGSPNKLFDNQYVSAVQARSYDVTPDGKRFLFIKNAAPGDQSTTSASPRIIVVENWIEELKRLVPTN